MKLFRSLIKIFIYGACAICLTAFSFDTNQLNYLQQHIDERVQRELNHSIVLGLISLDGSVFLKAGNLSANNPQAADESSIYALGSVTKVFTATTAAALVEDKQLSWKSSINAFFPEAADPPTWKGKSPKLEHLASHTAAFPLLPIGFEPTSAADPFHTYSIDSLHQSLSKSRLPYPPGKHFLYSEFGYALLGNVIELRTGQSFPQIFAEKISQPLGLKDTGFELSSGQHSRYATGHQGMTPVEAWTFGAVPYIGGLHSTPADLLHFIGINLGLKKSESYEMLKRQQYKYKKADLDDTSTGLGWYITDKDGTQRPLV